MPAHYQKHSPQPIINPYQEERQPIMLGKRIQTSLEDRWAIVGMTGSGKTTYAKELLRHLKTAYPAMRTYILDTKQVGDFDMLPAGAGLFKVGYRVPGEVPPDPLHMPGAFQIWQPPDDNLEVYDEWFKKILQHRQPAVILVDETSSILNKAGDGPMYYNRLLKLGRAFGICVLSLTQEAAYVPRNLLGQATHIVRFGLLDGYDVKKLDKMVGRPLVEHGLELPDPYGFFHRRTGGKAHGHYYKNHQEFFR